MQAQTTGGKVHLLSCRTWGEDVEPETSMLLVGMWNGTPSLESRLVASYRVNLHLLCDPAIPLMKAYGRSKTCTGMFTAALFVAQMSIIGE